jgi:N-ethylmaleimide reductase
MARRGDYAQATRNAIAAGFDGVELHAASGYLPMQFLSTGSNHRTDQYGGSPANRVRFVIEALESMIAAAGSPGKVGIKISPCMPFNDIQDDEPAVTYDTLVKAIDPLNLAYLHIMRVGGDYDAPRTLRPLFHGKLLVGGGFTPETGEAALAAGDADAIVFGGLYIANPDLTARIARQAALAQPDQSTFYTPGPKGYTDYPALA